MKKIVVLVLLLTLVASSVFASDPWWYSGNSLGGSYDRDGILKTLQKAVPVPQIRNAQERKMVAWRATLFDVPDKLGYVYLTCAGVGFIGYYTIFGKVASLNSFIVPQEEYAGSGAVIASADIDGTWGENIDGVFFRTDNGTYVEIPTNGPIGYLYSDKPIPIKVPQYNPAVSTTAPAPKK